VDKEVSYEGVKLWLSPWSNSFMNWAFMKDPNDLVEVYAKIPEGIDILVSHQPPIDTNTTIYDFEAKKKIEVGSKELADTIDRVKPRIVICGHIHVAQGHYVRGTTDIYNVTVVNEAYKNVYDPTEILWTK
jgi:Icc-related predicted phosphoesterase